MSDRSWLSRIMNWKLGLAIAWSVFTSSLALWWLVYGLRQLNRVEELSSQELIRQQKMLFWEGGILVALLFIGGGSLIYYMVQLLKTNENLKQFFGTFSHELRTSIASLRLQAESLRDDHPNLDSPELPRLVKESIRLQLQLENSLTLAQFETSSLFLQPVSVTKLISTIHHQWPGVKILVQGEDEVYADERALHSVFTNLMQNSVYHGAATEVVIEFQPSGSSLKTIIIRDNGRGFDGDWDQLSKLFVRHNHKSGSGVGLFLAKALIKKMNGKFSFNRDSKEGFGVVISLPSGAKS